MIQSIATHPGFFSFLARDPVPADGLRRAARTSGKTVEVPRHPGSKEESPRLCGAAMAIPELTRVSSAPERSSLRVACRDETVGYAWGFRRMPGKPHE